MSDSLRSASRGTLIFVLLSMQATVTAQDQPASVESRVALEVVVVTAQKRAQSSQEVPIAIAALTGDILEQSGVSDVFDVAIRVPSLGVQNNERPLSTQFRLRGIGNFGSIPNFEPHGQANAMSVLLSTHSNGVQLAVSDNGSGFDPNHVRVHASLGLASMRERVRMLHGQLDIESTPGRGTAVVAWVPG